ncbi:MAG: DUF342 domain-containing protein [Candidatus Hydrogenedentes bacterium]|nr:DUF342 domain-containing protein [Candidatus Hydrogenedentota bacterium]
MVPGQSPEHSEAPRAPAEITEDSALEAGEESDGFRLMMSKDRMQVTLDCDTQGRNLDELAAAVLARLSRFHLSKPPSIEKLQASIHEAASRTPQFVGVEILSGTLPRPPVDGRIEWSADFFNPGFELDEATGRINFRRRIGNRNVAEGQLLATVVEPVSGTNGVDLQGSVVRVRKPRRCKIRAGENVEADAAGLNYFATVAGRIRWHKEVLSVDLTFEIQGDVGLETGDISHEGAVLVHGDILPGSRLEAVGDIEVMGTIDGAQVQTGGALHVHGGITGNEHTRIVAACGVQARFILDAHILAGGDVTVESEVVHSTVSTRGAFYVPRGRIVGGEINALGGVDVGQIGSPASVPTMVIAGEDHSIEGQIAILRNKLRLATENVDRVHNTLAALRGKIANLPEKSKTALRTLLGNLPAMEAAVVDLKEAITDAYAESHALARPVILVRLRLYPESRLRIQQETLHVREEVPGPVRPILVERRLRLAATHMQHIQQSLDPVTGFLLHHDSH